MRFYYLDAAGATAGPVTPIELGQLYTAGTVTAVTPVIQEGDTDWHHYAHYLPVPAVARAETSPAPRPAAPSLAGATIPATAAPGGPDAIEERVRERMLAGAAAAGATARVLSQTAAAAARGTARAFGELTEQGATNDAASGGAEASVGAAAYASPGASLLGSPRGALIGAGVWLASTLLLPMMVVVMKGQTRYFWMYGMLHSDAGWNGPALLAFVAPVAALVSSRLGGRRWAVPTLATGVIGAILLFLAFSNATRMVRAASLGMAESGASLGLWVAALAALTVAAHGALATLAARSHVVQP